MRRAELTASLGGCVLVLVALVIIWAAKLSIPRDLYVSELGAEGMPTEGWLCRPSASETWEATPAPRARRARETPMSVKRRRGASFTASE